MRYFCLTYGFRLVALCLKTWPCWPPLKDFYNSVLVDKKWLFLSEKELHLYIATDETVPHQTCQNKDNMIKVMFLTAVAAPWFNEGIICTFDGNSARVLEYLINTGRVTPVLFYLTLLGVEIHDALLPRSHTNDATQIETRFGVSLGPHVLKSLERFLHPGVPRVHWIDST